MRPINRIAVLLALACVSIAALAQESNVSDVAKPPRALTGQDVKPAVAAPTPGTLGVTDIRGVFGSAVTFATHTELESYGFAFGPSDGQFGAIPSGGTGYTFFGTAGSTSSCAGTPRVKGVFTFTGTLDHVTGSNGCRRLFGPGDGPAGWVFDKDYAGGGQVVRFASGGKSGWFMPFHGEVWWQNPATSDYKCNVLGGAGSKVNCFYSSLGLAISIDDGKTFKVAGQILQPSQPMSVFTGGGTNMAVGYGSLVVADANGKHIDNPPTDPSGAYFYLFYTDFSPGLPGACAAAICMGIARARYADVVAAALSDDPHKVAKVFKKYDGASPDPWIQPATGDRPDGSGSAGKYLPLWSDEPGGAQVIYDKSFDVYLAVYQSRAGIKVRASSDLIHWSGPIGAPYYERGRTLYYPTFLGEAGDPTVGGPAPRVYFSSFPTGLFPNYKTAIFESVQLTLARAGSAEPLHPNAGGNDAMADAVREPAMRAVKSAVPAAPESMASAPVIRYVPGSTKKLEQLIGDEDKERHQPTLSRTVTRYGLQGTDLGYSFEHEGRAYFLFGDTVGRLDRALDTIATTEARVAERGVRLDFLTVGKDYLTIQPPGIRMGPFEVPVAGISLGGQMYVVASTNHSPDRSTDRSVLTKFTPPATFKPLRTISQLPIGRIIKMSLHAQSDPGSIAGMPPGGPFVMMWGTGLYRQSDAYLSIVTVSHFETGEGTRYFTGSDAAGAPTWSEHESDAKPIIQNGTMGDLSVTWCKDLGLWLMTFDSRAPAPAGVEFSYSRAPWGPWSEPQTIFNAVRDGALGTFIHNPSANPVDGLARPVIGKGQAKPEAVRGGAYAPYVIERFTRVEGGNLNLYYVMSTWNPYVVVLMRSEFTITREP